MLLGQQGHQNANILFFLPNKMNIGGRHQLESKVETLLDEHKKCIDYVMEIEKCM